MTNQEILDKLMFIINDIKGDTNITEDTALLETGILDSLEVINYLTQIEEYLELNISMDELVDNKLGIIKNMVTYIAQKQNG